MRISEYFQLGRSQPELEFVDVDLNGDTKLFVDPRALRLHDSNWTSECTALIQDFFRQVLVLIAANDDRRAQELLRVLREPNETHLGLSRGRPRGHGLGDESAVDVWQALSDSEAVHSGLLEDLEDTILVIPGIGSDIISDISTNIIRQPLVRFTQDVCRFYGIGLSSDVASGPMWDPLQHRWFAEYVDLPVTEMGRLLLIPKSIVRRRMEYDPEDYFNNYILPALQEAELAANGELVQLLKNGNRRVTKKSLREKYGSGKHVAVELTKKNPEILDQYRQSKRLVPGTPVSHEDIAAAEGASEPDWDRLLEAVTSIEPGTEGATRYHRAVEGLLQALFFPALVNPERESNLHAGRKRIDIKFTNASKHGFFWRVHEHHGVPAGFVVVECKNYTEEVANPEFDQLAGRFSPTRGRLGLLVCRSIEDRDTCIARCKDAASDDRGWILPLADDDLRQMVEERKGAGLYPYSVRFRHLEDLFSQVVS